MSTVNLVILSLLFSFNTIAANHEVTEKLKKNEKKSNYIKLSKKQKKYLLLELNNLCKEELCSEELEYKFHDIVCNKKTKSCSLNVTLENVLENNNSSKMLDSFVSSISSKKGTTQAGVNYLMSQKIDKIIT